MTKSVPDEQAVAGLHAHLLGHFFQDSGDGSTVLELGCGAGSLARSLHERGYAVTACDQNPPTVEGVSMLKIDLDRDDWPVLVGGSYDLVAAVEVIEHLENTQLFLRRVASVLSPTGLAVVTSPRFESIAARLQFLRQGTLRLMDQHGDPTHVTPIFKDLLLRQYLPRSGLALVNTGHYPESGSASMRPLNRAILGAASRFPPLRELMSGDVNIFVLALKQAS